MSDEISILLSSMTDEQKEYYQKLINQARREGIREGGERMLRVLESGIGAMWSREQCGIEAIWEAFEKEDSK